MQLSHMDMVTILNLHGYLYYRLLQLHNFPHPQILGEFVCLVLT